MTDDSVGSVVLLTGDGLRHRYVAAELAQTTALAGLVYEGKTEIVPNPQSLAVEDERVIRRHLEERDAVERRLLGNPVVPETVPALAIEHGSANSPRVFAWVRERAPNFVVLYGTSIIKPPLLEAFADRMVNIHLGLSPYYRGSGTNFWPLVDRRPECVGATLHLVAAKVDAGPIVAQVRPEAQIDDRAHDLGTKTIIAAVKLLPRVLSAIARGRAWPRAQELSRGKLCRRRDFNADAVRTMWRQFDTGMMPEYLAQAAARRAAYPIVELPGETN